MNSKTLFVLAATVGLATVVVGRAAVLIVSAHDNTTMTLHRSIRMNHYYM
jgi:hypothetical protein